MHIPSVKYFTIVFFSVLVASPVQAELLKRDFTIEVRQVESRDAAAGIVVGTQARAPGLVTQRVDVRNGEKATMRFNVSMPMQWVQKLESLGVSTSVSGSASQTVGAGLTNAVTWMDAGQSITVTPRWTHAKQPVLVEIDILTAAVDERTGVELPNQFRSQTATLVSAPLGEWTTIATEGTASKAGVYSSAPGADGVRAIQLRVTAK